eukprot:4619611-Pleurochrysis_carterae.AAC.3
MHASVFSARAVRNSPAEAAVVGVRRVDQPAVERGVTYEKAVEERGAAHVLGGAHGGLGRIGRLGGFAHACRALTEVVDRRQKHRRGALIKIAAEKPKAAARLISPTLTGSRSGRCCNARD